MYLPSLRGLDKIGINDEAFIVYNLHMLILLSGGHTRMVISVFIPQLCQLLCTVILYRTTKFRSTNIVAITILDPIISVSVSGYAVR